MEKKVTIIGAAITDVHAGPVSSNLFEAGSVPVENMAVTYGGDALNEAVMLSSLGVDSELVSVVGDDENGKRILNYLKSSGINTDKITVCDGMTTGMNIVLNDASGERFFITNPRSSLRRLSVEHILPHADEFADIVCFASMFVSHELGIKEMRKVFSKIKEKPSRVLICDMTTAKKGENIRDIAELLEYIDYIVPNEKEAALLTGESDIYKNIDIFRAHGAKNVVIKCGSAGCVYSDGKVTKNVPSFKVSAIDTTGAGDSFVAGFTYGLLKGSDIHTCCKYGNAVASYVVEQIGTTGIKLSDDDIGTRM